jgi:hypothetical protein
MWPWDRSIEFQMSRFFKIAVVALVILLTISCSSRTAPETTSGESSTAQGNLTAGPRFDLVNFTGIPLRAVYLSPGDSSGWEENVLGTDTLDDGATVDIRFVSHEAPALWDLKVVAKSGYYAEWKGLDLRGVSRVTLAVTLLDEATAVAELE